MSSASTLVRTCAASGPCRRARRRWVSSRSPSTSSAWSRGASHRTSARVHRGIPLGSVIEGCASARFFEEGPKVADHRLDHSGHRAHGRDAGWPYGYQAPRLASALGTRLTKACRHKALEFQPLKGGEHVGASYRSTGALFDVVGDGDGVGLVRAETQGGEEHE